MILSLVKALHIAALVVWCAGLLGLPLMLSKHEIGEGQASYSQLRLLTHRAYSYLVTPAAIIAISAGTVLIFLAGVFTLWMLVTILFLVLGKPALSNFAPEWLNEPLGHELPVEETPI